MNLLILMLRLNKQVNLFDGIADVIYFKLGNDCLPCLLLCYYVYLMLFLSMLFSSCCLIFCSRGSIIGRM